MPIASPSSPFAALLRRSKFASYDRSIGQVYSSFEGHLHRGNFGFKRPLPTRGRQAHIMVEAVDSREEQTEWRRADNEVQYMKMWDEVGITPTLDEHEAWASKLGPKAEVEWRMDSEFAVSDSEMDLDSNAHSSTLSELYGPISSATPNIHAMSDREFEQYITKLRKSRPAFAEYMKEITAKRVEKAEMEAGRVHNTQKPRRGKQASHATEFDSFWEISRRPARDHKIFLGSQTYKSYNSPDSHTIEQQPQQYAGLQYAKHPLLQSQLLNQPAPGRAITERDGSAMYISVTFAGNKALCEDNSAITSDTLEFRKLAQTGEQDHHAGVANFRFTRALLTNPAQVVGERPQPLRTSRLETIVKVEKDVDMEKSNTHWPGSPEYVGHTVARINSDTILSARKKTSVSYNRSGEPTQSVDVLHTLRDIMGNGRKS